MRVAAIDCGTNSLRLLVADRDGSALTEVSRLAELVRLGEGVDASGRISPEAMERAWAVVDRYAQVCDELGVTAARFVATSAARDAANAQEFFAGVRASFADCSVIDGDEEAALSFLGARSVLSDGVADSEGRILVVDLGGGSTEFVVGAGEVEAAVSLDMGSVRLHERHLHDDPPTPAQIASAAAEIEPWIDEAEAAVGFGGLDALVGVAGTVTSLTAHALKLPDYDRDRVHGALVPLGVMLGACDHLLEMPTAARAALPYMPAGREDVIGAGALIWSRIIRRVVDRSPEVALVTSEADILDGVAMRL